jgi:LuxR family maltose regulon positive regulatory protein
MIGVSVLLAMVYQRQEKANKALSVLKKAVIMAQPGGFLRPFIELGAPMVELLKQLAKHQKIKGFVRRLLVAFRHEAASSVQDESDTQNAQNLSVITGELLEPLTNRELEVLTLLSQGLSNKEIASKMYLSSETIKKHVYNIYQKLYVHSRISAIERARELGILPQS